MKYLEIYEALRIDGLDHFGAMVEICNAIEEDFYNPDEWVDDICDYIEEKACVR